MTKFLFIRAYKVKVNIESSLIKKKNILSIIVLNLKSSHIQNDVMFLFCRDTYVSHINTRILKLTSELIPLQLTDQSLMEWKSAIKTPLTTMARSRYLNK